MATNASPLGIFQTALGTMPRPLNLSEQLANYNLTQSQAAEAQARVPQIQSLTQAQQLENQKTQIQLGLDQQARTLAKQYQQTVPTTPPPANFPAPAISGYDDEGNPQYAATPDWHAAAAQASAPAGHFDFDGYAAALMKAGDIDRALSVSKTAQELRQKNADTAKKEMDNFEAVRSLKADVTTPIVQALDKGDVAGAQDLWNGIDAETLNRMGVPPGTAFNPDAIRNQNKMALGYEGATKQIKDNLAIKETGAKTESELATAEHARAAAELTREQTTQLKISDEAAAEFIKNPSSVLGPGGLVERMNFDPETTNRLKNQIYGIWQMPGTPKEKQTAITAAIQKATDQANDISKEKALIPVKAQQAAANATATLPAELAKAKALREGDNPALSGVPPNLAQFATTQAGKLDNDYNKSKQTAEEMNAFINMAEAGNKAAAAEVPLAGTLQITTSNGVKRINRTEVEQFQGAGSLWDRIEGKLGKVTKGQPIPTDVLEDMRTMAGMIGNEAYGQYTTGLKSLNDRTGAKFGPNIEAPKVSKPQTASTLPVITTQKDFDALPKGAYFKESDGKTYRKP